jgi:RAVE protein 1 C terminal
LPVVISPPETPRLDAKLFSADDPALIVLYKQLRDKSLQTLRGAVSISPRVEWQFVMHTARLYCRMGCDLLALDLGKIVLFDMIALLTLTVRNWEFLAHRPLALPAAYPVQSPTTHQFAVPSPQLAAFDHDPRRLLRRRSSLVVDDLSLDFTRHSLLDEPSIVEAEESVDVNGNGDKKHEEPTKKVPFKEEKKKPPPTMFHEPDANSLLDSFGF